MVPHAAIRGRRLRQQGRRGSRRLSVETRSNRMKRFHTGGIVFLFTLLSHSLVAFEVGRPWDSPGISLGQESTGREATAPGTATYFVSPSGDNSNPGTREARWAAPGYGSRQIQSGDTLVILGGRYRLSVFDADIISPPSGTAEAWTTILGEEGNTPVFAGSGNLYSAMILSGRSYDQYQIGDLGKRNIYGDPLFLLAAFGTDGDYHLQDGSPGIDTGSSVFAPPIDLDGTPRPRGDGHDICCYKQ